MYNKDQDTRTLLVPASDCQNRNQIQLFNYDINALIKSQKNLQKTSCCWIYEYQFNKDQNLEFKRTIIKAPIGIVFISENKLDRSFPDAQSQINNYQFTPFRKHKNNKERSKLIFIRKDWKDYKKTNKFRN